ncbi:hypothetical protein ACEPTV_33170, partial [Burkholderia pseudomallei]|uniref:hypothetical protein n=1 Tax=Burkholderia pseudomallei TaxID=28450 RepID=UPI00358FB093
RDLRRVGDDVIERQRAILSGPLPPGVQVAGKTLKLVRGRGGKVSLRKVNRYQDAAVKRPGR